jgi:hypothetical protein
MTDLARAERVLASLETPWVDGDMLGAGEQGEMDMRDAAKIAAALAEVRAEALEEAARVTMKTLDGAPWSKYATTVCAEAIRALASKEAV